MDSPVAGARVYVNAKAVGVTPLQNWKLPAGSHVVRVEADGYQRWSSVVQIVTGRTLNLMASLQPLEVEREQ